MAINLTLLKTAAVLSGLDDAALETVAGYCGEKRLAAGETILWQGSDDRQVYFLISGTAKLFVTSDEGREFIVRIAYPGESINDDGLFESRPALLSAASLSPVLLYSISQPELLKLMQRFPAMVRNIALAFEKRHRYMVRLSAELVFKDVTGRLARLLLERERTGKPEENGPKITQQDMAFMIGTVRELVSRSLRELEMDGTISIKQNRIVINNREKLKELSRI